ncbi:protein ripply2 [Eucyclogobius newberryi]|uniref:protein ripply2 n=1 Tax=Eucyclogobius newberryi TaxID=166745 RepID=UPI003B590996
MENLAFYHGFITKANGTDITHRSQSAPVWRPWTGTNCAVTHRAPPVPRDVSDSNLVKSCLQVVHPVKLFWPKSRCFDYLYQDAELLLRNYPVQATICPCEDSGSDEENEDESEEEEKEEEEEEMAKHELN